MELKQMLKELIVFVRKRDNYLV